MTMDHVLQVALLATFPAVVAVTSYPNLTNDVKVINIDMRASSSIYS